MIRKKVVSGYTEAYVIAGASDPVDWCANANAGGSVEAPAKSPQISK